MLNTYLSQCSCVICHELKSIKGIHSHYIRSHTDEGRELGKQNGRIGAQTGKTTIYNKSMSTCKKYYLSPVLCKECNCVIDWFSKNNKFCSNVCSGIYSNKLRPKGHSSRTQGNTGRIAKLSKDKVKITNLKPKYTRVSFCCYCGKCFPGKTKTCSQECFTNHMIRQANSRPKHFRPANRAKIIYNGIGLGSAYELSVCMSLDKYGVKWEVPNGMKYLDNTNKVKTYYADLYLPEFNVYLDPKNDYLINNPNPYHGYKDSDKINWAENYNNVKIIILDKNHLAWPDIKILINGRDSQTRTDTNFFDGT